MFEYPPNSCQSRLVGISAIKQFFNLNKLPIEMTPPARIIILEDKI